MDCSLPGSSVQGIFQTRVLEWVAIPFSSLETTRGLMQWWVGGECGGEFLGEDLGKSHLARSQISALSWKALMPANSGCCPGFWVQTQPPLLSNGVTSGRTLRPPGSAPSGVSRVTCMYAMAFPVAQLVKTLPAVQETWVQSLGREDSPEKEMTTHSNILAWRIPWTEEPAYTL